MSELAVKPDEIVESTPVDTAVVEMHDTTISSNKDSKEDAVVEEKEKVTVKPNGSEENKTALPKDSSQAGDEASSSNLPSWNYANRKVLIQGVMKFHNKQAVTKMLNKWIHAMKSSYPEQKIQFEKVKKPPLETWAVVTMTEEAMVQPFIDYINDNNIENKKGNKLFAKPADNNDNETDDRSGRKRKHDDKDDDKDDDDENGYAPSKRQRDGDADATAKRSRRPVTEEEVKNKITPLWKLSPEEQLSFKMKDMVKNCAMKIVKEVNKKFRILNKERSRKHTPVYPWIAKKRCIEVDSIISAPTPLRNKSEFTFGYRYLFEGENSKNENSTNTDGEEHNEGKKESEMKIDTPAEPKAVPSLGFMATGWAGGVSPPHCCQNIPPEHCAIVDIVDEFLRTSALPVYDSKSHKGFWRLLTVRSSRRTQECMIIIQHSPPKIGGEGEKGDDDCDYSKDFENEKPRLVKLLTDAELSVPDQAPIKITSIFFQEYGGLSSPPPEHPVQHAYGKTSLTEKLGKCSFQISPGAFFQVNTEGAEMLYQLAVDKVKEVSMDPANTLLFDVCCGTGTIGMTCMKEGVVGQVIGVDISEPAIMDAKKNAELNGFADESESKTRFVAAKAEDVLATEITKARSTGKNFVALVDPARDGLHGDVVKTLRANEQIKRLVYVSCNPTGTLARDAALLCGAPTKRYSGLPFKIVSASPVDMFPLTNHCEMVMTFDRMTEAEIKQD